MSASRVIYAVYDDPDKTVYAAKKFTKAGVKVEDVYSPFPIHGIEAALNIPRTRISVSAFVFGAIGTSLALLMMWYMMINDWPMNIGGKPSFSLGQNLPSFIPVTFELTVLLGAHGMIATFFYLNGLAPGFASHNPDPRSTDDMIFVKIDLNKNKLSEAEIKTMIEESGAVEINEQN